MNLDAFTFDTDVNLHPPKQFKLVFFMFLLQVTYLVLTIVEADTAVNTYGTLAGLTMIGFGLTFLTVSVVRLHNRKSLNTDILFEIMEGLVYTSLGAALTGVRITKNSRV